MQRLRPGSTDRATGPLRLAPDLKAAAARAHLPLPKTAKKAELLAALPQTVPLDLVAEARVRLRRRRAEADLAEALAEPDAHLDVRITVTRAKSEFRLSEGDLAPLRFTTAPNPHARSAPPMRLYDRGDVIRAAHLKHGGRAGLEAARETAAARKVARKESAAGRAQRRKAAAQAALAARGLAPPAFDDAYDRHLRTGRPPLEEVVALAARRAELTAALAARGLALRGDSALCEAYISEGRGSLPAIVDTMHEMDFLVRRGQYHRFHDQAWQSYKEAVGWVDRSDGISISHQARAAAWRHLCATPGKAALLAMSDLPPTFRARLIQGGRA
jgi:hypothetical protein